MKNERTKTLAASFQRVGGAANTLHVYVDGIVLFLEASPDRHSAVRDVLRSNYPGFSEARAKGNSVFVVPIHVGPDTPVSALPPLLTAAAVSGLIEQRQEGASSLDAAFNQFWMFDRIRRHGLERYYYVRPEPPGQAAS